MGLPRKVPDTVFILSKLIWMPNFKVLLSGGYDLLSSLGFGRQDPRLSWHLPSGIKTEARHAAPATIFDAAHG